MSVFYIVDKFCFYSVSEMKILNDSQKKRFRALLCHLYWSNHLVAFLAAIALIPSFKLLSDDLSWRVLVFVYLSSFLTYSLDRSLSLSPEDRSNSPERSRWLELYKWRMYLSIFVYLPLTVWCFWNLTLSSQLLVVLLVLPTLSYVLPIIPYKGAWRRSQEFSWGKSFNISFVWASLASFLPACELGVWSNSLLLLFILNFAVTLASCQFFDLRDYLGDKSAGVKSLTVLKGQAYCRNFIRRLCYAVFLLSLLLCFSRFYYLILFSGVSAYYLNLLRSDRLDDMDYIFIDLALGLPAFMAVLFY